jgi:LysR family hydrogen peroxide-inducible transcriptional activator
MDLEQVTLTQLRYAAAVELTRSFRAAADRCHVSQSGLSMQIQKLEDLLGIVLFDRTKKPVLVTEEGARAIGQMREVLREMERLGQVVAGDDEPAGRYRLGIIPTLAPTVLPLFLGAFVDAHPRVELLIEELKTEEIIARLAADTLDAGVASTPLRVPGLTEVTLAIEPMVAYLAEGDPLLRRKSVTQANLTEHELWVLPEGHCFRSQVLSYCGAGKANPPRGVQFESGSFETLIGLVDTGLGATVLPALVARALPPARQRARVRPLARPTPLREIGLVTSRTQLRRRVTDALAGSIRAALEDALGPPPSGGDVLDPLPAMEP